MFFNSRKKSEYTVKTACVAQQQNMCIFKSVADLPMDTVVSQEGADLLRPERVGAG